jgi:hypothetical protein
MKTTEQQAFEILDAAQLAAKWGVPKTWVQDQTRSRALDPIPHVKLGRYTKFEWYSPQLAAWWARRRSSESKS